jgi:hypothetical protein
MEQTFSNTTMCYYRSRKVLLQVIVTQLRCVLIFSVTIVRSTVTQYNCPYLQENVLHKQFVVTHFSVFLDIRNVLQTIL